MGSARPEPMFKVDDLVECIWKPPYNGMRGRVKRVMPATQEEGDGFKCLVVFFPGQPHKTGTLHETWFRRITALEALADQGG